MIKLAFNTVVLLSYFICGTVFSQDPSFLDYVEQNAVIAGNLQNIDRLLDEASSIERFQNEYTDAVASLLFDEEFGLVSAEQQETLNDSIQELEGALRSCEEVFFIVHELSDKHISLSVALRLAKKEDKTEFTKTINLINTGLTAILKEAEKVLQTGSPIQFSLSDAGDWLILSNDKSAAAKLNNRARLCLGNWYGVRIRKKLPSGN